MSNTACTIENLHHLVDLLDPDRWDEAAHRLADLLDDPVLRAVAGAPIDDEPETEAERAAVAEARAGIGRGEGIPHAEIMRRYRGS